jgi:hypothetical protein
VRLVCTLLVAAALLAGAAATAEARSSFCSPTGDLCYGARGKGATVRLQITLIAHFFDRYRLCVTAPGGTPRCRRFRVHPAAGGTFASTVRWSAHFPFEGPGTYRARWRSGGHALGPAVSFLEGPSIDVRPARVRAGRRVRVFGLAGGCPQGDQVTLLSEAFPGTHEFAGVPAVFAKVDALDSYSVRVRIPAGRAPGRYAIGARCGGGNFGVSRALTVLPP